MTSSDEQRFWAKVDIPGHDECWLWNASTDGRYGEFWLGGRKQKASRVSWMIRNGPIPSGSSVCHACDNPRCVNPGHLFLGTHHENMLDSSRKGRNGTHTKPERNHFNAANPMKTNPRRGEQHKTSRLTAAQVLEIRALRGRVRQKDIAKKFGVSRDTIYKIWIRRLWDHV